MKHLISKGIDKRILKLEPRTVDVDTYSPIKREKELYTEKLNGHTRILYVGRLSKEKDLDVLMQAFYQLSEEDGNVALIVVGDGPYRQELERTCNNGHVVLFTGYLHGEELQKVYASSDIFVFPSTTDTFGKVVLEAQASGLPAIVSDLGGPHEIIIPGETGITVPNKNPEAFKDALKYLVSHPNIRKSMSVKARKMAESRSTDAIFEEYWKTGAYAS
jgi:glycosyltransferase involved in cell wall biosynthesis